MSGTRYDEGFADGVDFAARIVLNHLRQAMDTPRESVTKKPTDRRGKIVALGLVLAELAPSIDYTTQTDGGTQ